MLRVFFLGMQGQFSRIVLARLLTADVTVVGIGVDGRGEPDSLQYLPPQLPVGDLPLATPYLHPSIIQLGWQADIPSGRWGMSKLMWWPKAGSPCSRT
jgi:hypothetical protein